MDMLSIPIDGQRLATARRAFIRTSGLAVAAYAALGDLETAPALADTIDDATIFNFALNLEYLEAEYYLRAAFGRGLHDTDTNGTGALGTVVGGSKVPFSTAAIRGYAEEIAGDEEHHVQFIRGVLGGVAVARPKIDLRTSFTSAARAAGVIGPGDTFNPFSSETNFLLGAFIFEDVG